MFKACIFWNVCCSLQKKARQQWILKRLKNICFCLICFATWNCTLENTAANASHIYFRSKSLMEPKLNVIASDRNGTAADIRSLRTWFESNIYRKACSAKIHVKISTTTDVFGNWYGGTTTTVAGLFIRTPPLGLMNTAGDRSMLITWWCAGLVIGSSSLALVNHPCALFTVGRRRF